MTKRTPPKPEDLPDLPESFPELRPEIKADIADKSDAQASTELSKNRTRMSEFRTQLSEDRTGLSEHRTDLSEHRTALSEKRSDLSEHRTALSDVRSHLSNERTHLSQVRTAVSLISLGVTLNRFAVYLEQSNRAPPSGRMLGSLRDIETAGIGMVVLGVAVLLWGLYRYNAVYHQIETLHFKPPARWGVVLLTLLIIAGGALSAIWMILR